MFGLQFSMADLVNAVVGGTIGAALGGWMTLRVAEKSFDRTAAELEALRDEIRADLKEIGKFLTWWANRNPPGTGTPFMDEEEEKVVVKRPVSSSVTSSMESLGPDGETGAGSDRV